MLITHKIKMDIHSFGNVPHVDVMCGDAYTRKLEFVILSGGLEWIVPDGASAVVRYSRSDGYGGLYDTLPDGEAACTIEGNVVTAIIAPQALSAPGIVKVSVALMKEEQVLGLFPVVVNVEVDPSMEATKGESYYNYPSIGAINEAIADLESRMEEMEQGGSGITNEEKKVILTLFKSIPYASNVSAMVAELEALWSVSYKVTYNLTGAASSNNAASVAEGGTYTTTLTAEKLHTLKGAEVSVTMGGVDITSTAYSNGVITIESVTGAVVITVVAAEIVIADTTAVVETTGYGINRLGNTVAAENVGVTKAYDCPGAEDKLFAHIRIGDDVTYSDNYCRAVSFDTSGAVLNYSGAGQQQAAYLSIEAEAVMLVAVSANAATLKMAVGVNHLEYSYAYWKNTGAVLFAGKNTPYYGMANIDGTMA